jgi:(5-formylfuran-3-yl)methyl phosphate synthase
VTPGLLVSVRSSVEALAALAGGATLIDVKEPDRGPLGRADDEVVADVVRVVAGRCPVSAALGEFADRGADIPLLGLHFVKWGLAGVRPGWQDDLRPLLMRPGSPQVVLSMYADWQCADSPAPDDVLDLACRHPGSVLLIDTCCKDFHPRLGRRPHLLDWLSVDAIDAMCRRCREAEVRLALAGSLGRAEIVALRHVSPDWFAVRGAACAGGERQGVVHTECVVSLRRILQARPAVVEDKHAHP